MRPTLDPVRPDHVTDLRRPASRRPTVGREGRAHPTAALAAFLQKRLGNRGVQRLVQANLGVSEPGDVLERQAEGATGCACGGAGTKPSYGGGLPAGTNSNEHPSAAVVEAEGHPMGPASGPASALLQEALGNPGHPIGAVERSDFEARLGTDLGGVRVHDHPAAWELARAVGARAFALENQVVFAQGTYAPRTAAGRMLLAHELAHVVQSAAGAPPQLRRQPDPGGQHHLASHPMNPPKPAGTLEQLEQLGVLEPLKPMTLQELSRDPAFLAYLKSIEEDRRREERAADEELDLGPLLPAGLQLEEAAGLRAAYQEGARAIGETAQKMLDAGVKQAEVAEWATNARNALKQEIRTKGARIIKALAEARNMKVYGNPLGPSAEQLRAAGKSDAQIIEGAKRSNPSVSRWTGRLRVAGRILIALDIGIGLYNVGTAGNEWPRVLMRETGRIGGGVGGAYAGAKAFGLAFSWTGPIGAGIAAGVGGIGGALLGSWAGSKVGDFVADQFWPPAQTAFEGDFVVE
jgi:hypothetical protein